MPIIQVDKIKWKYEADEPEVINDISLEIEPKEFVGIMGPTGAGKTSLALALRGLIPSFFEDGKFQGKVTVHGIDVSNSSPQLFANVVGSVFQDASSQILGTTVFDDIAFGPGNLNLAREEVINRVNTYADKLKLKNKLYRDPDALSGGEMQRLVAAGALCMEPKVLIMDEPAAELDPKGRQDLGEILDGLRDGKDITVVLIEQDPELIAKYSSKVAIMSKGEVVAYGTAKDVFAKIDLCDRVGVSPPEMVKLYFLLKDQNIELSTLPLTSEEMFSELKKVFNISESKDNDIYEKKLQYSEFVRNDIKPLYEFENLVHTYSTPSGPFNALDGLNLKIYPGDYITLIGTNGAGKTTLTKHINNILEPTQGTVKLNGENIKGRGVSEFLSEVGYCFQNPDHQIFSNTVKEEVAYGLLNLGLPQEEINKKVDDILELVGLSNVKDENPFSLGKGERQKIAIASTVVMEPKFLVIDEPTTGLDWNESKKILELIETLHKRGMTILAVTHDMRIVREYSTRVVAMNKGKIIFDGDITGLLDNQELFENANINLPPVLDLYHKLKPYFPEIADIKVRTIEDMSQLLAGLYEKHVKRV